MKKIKLEIPADRGLSRMMLPSLLHVSKYSIWFVFVFKNFCLFKIFVIRQPTSKQMLEYQ